MADTPGRFVGQSMEELLVGLAEGVRNAQQALSEAPGMDAIGRPMPTYHLPYLDFSVQIDIATETGSAGRGLPIIKLRSLAGSSQTSKNIGSNLSGRLVAVPPDNGLPHPVLTIRAGERTGTAVPLDIHASNAAGEDLAGQPVELNIDDAQSAILSAGSGAANFSRGKGCRLETALAITDVAGRAHAVVHLDKADIKSHPRAVLMIVATLGALDASVVVPLSD